MLDIEDRGPMLRTDRFALRVTNCGILGNAFFNVGRSNDPSFEFPIYSGHECLNHAALWVGAENAQGERRVSGGELMEWRPTLDPEDRVRIADHGFLGGQRRVDDDGDGRIDEEILNGKDDDGDGRIDEDLGLFAQETLAADYVDDRPEAVNFVYSAGETHHPLGLSVHQEVYGWNVPGYDTMAGLQFTITNHSSEMLRQVYVGLLADLDLRRRDDVTGHLNDKVVHRTYSRTIYDGTSRLLANSQYYTKQCFTTLQQTVPILIDGDPNSGLPAVAVMGLDHTTDPLGYVLPDKARAPTRVSFRYSVFLNGTLPSQGGVPIIDQNRYEALAGSYPEASEERPGDYVILVSCGPFAMLGPGQSLDFSACLIAADNPDTLVRAMADAAFLQRGTRLNLLPDSTGPYRSDWKVGNTGVNGHEVCLRAPPGTTFAWEPDCGNKFFTDYPEPPAIDVFPVATYRPDTCIWTDADCDACTGLDGSETRQPWLDAGEVPPSPGYRVVSGDHQMRIEWDNRPEVLLKAGLSGHAGVHFVGYRVYKLADWRHRESLLPPRKNWALLAAFGSDTLDSQRRLSSVTDTTMDYDRILYEQKLYPPGRYSMVDRDVLNGFDYAYVVTTVVELVGQYHTDHAESPLVVGFDQVVSPHAAAQAAGGKVWVVPNPFRGYADWDRPATVGDQLTRHIDFMGLPRAVSTIKIWTLAGDFVAQIDHDGRTGNGQAAWNLVSRNGQEVESGLYLFTVDSPLGHQIGRFVVIR